MTDGNLYRKVVDTIAATMPPEADLTAVRVEQDDEGGRFYISIWSSTLSVLIGRRGTTAETIRTALSEVLTSQLVQFNIYDALRPDDGPPSGPPGGVREPRAPRPGAPSEATSVEEPQ